MEARKIEELIGKYNEGFADPVEVKLIEQLLETGEIELTQLRELNLLDQQLLKMEAPSPSIRLDDQFYSFLADERRKQRMGRFSFKMPDWNTLLPRLAFASVVLVAGFVGGYLYSKPSQKLEVYELTQQVSELREMMIFSLLERESATDRLKAVGLTSEMDQVSVKVTAALFKTLNQDDNANVRLAALEAIKPYSKQSRVREELVRSIKRQDSPLVQIALAEFMAAIQEKKSVEELQKLLQNENTPKEVRSKINESIKVLI
ncbi:MAG: HEAT repeat domain-containing protein [Bacteroidia bacterium]|nr:HEAT repeat domain-containing protein [Bacteroidia bacterium]